MKHFVLWLILLSVLVVPLVASAQADDDDATEDTIPAVIYGNEDALRNNILFTIDDCFDEELTLEMYNFLNERELQAVFFPLSTEIIDHNADMWQAIVADGFEIGYHTRDHQANKSIEELEEDFVLFKEEVRQVLDDPDYIIRYARPPYGTWDANWLTWADERDLVTVRWNLVTRFDLTMEYFEAVLQHEDGGGIVLMHPRPTDMNWLKNHIDSVLALRTADDEPYRIVNLTEAFADDEVEAQD
jgi:peptidoglycan/xylan/chitin deacetylase (PgdA/CDA1 family)